MGAAMKARPWVTLRWGVTFQSRNTPHEPPILIGRLWTSDGLTDVKYPDYEPGRALLFHRRHQARTWCAAKNAGYAAYPEGHICRAWRMRVVRVRETVTVVA